MITKSIIYSIIIIGFSFGDVMFSMLNQNSIYFSYSYCFDNVDYINQDSESVSSKASYNNYKIGYVLNGKYDFNIKVTDNNSSVNDFDIPFKDVYKTIGFKYNLKNYIILGSESISPHPPPALFCGHPKTRVGAIDRDLP